MTPYYRESQNQHLCRNRRSRIVGRNMALGLTESEMNALKNHQIMSPEPAASESRVVERVDEELRDNAGSIRSQRLEEEGESWQHEEGAFPQDPKHSGAYCWRAEPPPVTPSRCELIAIDNPAYL